MQLPRGKYAETIDNFWLYTVSWRSLPLFLCLSLTPCPPQMLAAIGETFETPYVPTAESEPSSTEAPPPSTIPSSFSNEITGVIVSSRKAFYRINIWTRTSSAADEERIKNIGKHFKYGVLGLEKGLTISERDKVSSDVEFVSHKDSQAKVRSCSLRVFRRRRADQTLTITVRYQGEQVDRLIPPRLIVVQQDRMGNEGDDSVVFLTAIPPCVLSPSSLLPTPLLRFNRPFFEFT